MVKINSKKKGNKNEREIVKILNDYYKTDIFQRCPSSGALATTSKKLTKIKADVLIGDIIVPEDYPFFYEVKNLKNLDLWKIFELEIFDRVVEEEHDKQKEQLKYTNKKDIVFVFRTNNRKWLCCYENLNINLDDISYIYIKNKNRYILNFEDFLKKIEYKINEK